MFDRDTIFRATVENVAEKSLVLGRREHADTRRAEAVLALGHCQVLALGFSGARAVSGRCRLG
jgi:hypothetical protein